MVNTILQSVSQSGAKLAEDMKNGIVVRFRSLPIWMGSVLLAHSLIGLVRSALQQLLLLAIAFAFFGFRPAGGVLGVLAAWGLALVVGNGLGWIFIALPAGYETRS
jgi:ABC-2 type transport system permease protein